MRKAPGKRASFTTPTNRECEVHRRQLGMQRRMREYSLFAVSAVTFLLGYNHDLLHTIMKG